MSGLRDPAPAAATPAGAARACLAAKRDRHRIADPARDPEPAGTDTAGVRETVRLRQTYHGVPALDGEYIVRMDRKDGRRIVDVATGEDRVIQQSAPGTSLGPAAVTGDHVYWLLDGADQNGTTALRRAGHDGSGITDLSPETGPDALNISDLTVSGQVVTTVARKPVTGLSDESLSRLRQFAADKGDGLRRSRVSCNRGRAALRRRGHRCAGDPARRDHRCQ
ncbi:hypothetical protein V5F01_41985 [Streptomyces sp. NRRL B-2790]|uniref:hypothetical protein n=1 Tax=Streptomyces sp. NRRL B-2790 TaxID=1463835 RepID=UPI0035660DD8